MEARHVFSSSCVILGLFIAIVHGAHFEFSDGQQPCILLDIDATFDLSMGTQMADPFSIEGANKTASQSLCGSETTSALLSLRLFPTDEPLKINFRRDESTQSVSMSVVLTLDPPKHFENASEIVPFELEDSLDLPIGMINMSFKCNSQQEMVFNQDPGYSMSMKITNLHVQAYDIENGTFSPAIECDQDFATTDQTTTPTPASTMEEQTTEPINPTTTMKTETTPETPATIVPETTTPETNATSPEPEPETTTPTPEQETTTPEPVPTTTPKLIPKYEVKDGDKVCVLVQGEIKFNINYERNDNKTDTQNIPLPEDAKVTGQCNYNGTNTTQEFKVSFFNDKWSFSAFISQDEENLLKSSGSLLQDLKAEPSYSWKKIQLTYVVDTEHFDEPKESDIGKEQTVIKNEDQGVFRASDEGSYKCNTVETVELDEEVSMDLENFQYKAFGTDESADFPNNDVSECAADKGGDDDDDDDHTVAIVLGSVFGGLAFIILIVVIGVCVKRRKQRDYEVM
ncbi:lysosome-associated membrane glycoprotein 1-like [Mercenaria mercenaria]|uniref:lysosome-associated membrane glycoprotein 1-like n=1 Tax=Mercenaria mercenaria TaxID=6596 RepID=UPI00234ED47F|nr:lysosome-associated membrane glycoprotein 1-like [Mercenaria mercenaria]